MEKNDKKTEKKNKIDEKKVKEILEEISQMLTFHGGYVSLVKIEGNKVYVSLQGTCQGCMMANYTLKNIVEAWLKEEIPEIKEVVNVNFESIENFEVKEHN
jgi:Fe-S cluster biogenesis protein NfuA